MDIVSAGLAEQVAAVASGEVISVELTRGVLAQIESLEPRLKAFSDLLREAALAEVELRDPSQASTRCRASTTNIASSRDVRPRSTFSSATPEGTQHRS